MSAINKILNWNLFVIGDTQTTLGSLLGVVAVILGTMLVVRIASRATTRFFERLTSKGDKAVSVYGRLVKVIVWVVALEICLNMLGIRLTALFAASGVFALGAGLAARNIVENFMAGAIIRIEKVVRPGDLMIVDDLWLIIKQVGVRTTKANTYDGKEVLIPNAMVTNSVVSNLTRHDRLHRVEVKIGVAYDSDQALVRKTLEEMAEKLEWRSKAEKPAVFHEGFGSSRVNYSVDVWIDDANDTRSRSSDLREAVWWSLKEAGIVIAFPQLDVHMAPGVVQSTDTTKP